VIGSYPEVNISNHKSEPDAAEPTLLGRLFENAAEQRVVFARRALIGLEALPTQLLIGLALHPGLTVGELAARAELAQPPVSRGLRQLRQLGLAEEELDADDARIRRYRLTEDGSERVAAFEQAAAEALRDRARSG